MKNVKFILFAAIALFLASCSTDTAKIAEQVRCEMESQLQNEYGADVTVDDLILVHLEGNKYDSITTVRQNGEAMQFKVNVIYDGKNWNAMWESLK